MRSTMSMTIVKAVIQQGNVQFMCRFLHQLATHTSYKNSFINIPSNSYHKTRLAHPIHPHYTKGLVYVVVPYC